MHNLDFRSNMEKCIIETFDNEVSYPIKSYDDTLMFITILKNKFIIPYIEISLLVDMSTHMFKRWREKVGKRSILYRNTCRIKSYINSVYRNRDITAKFLTL